MNANTLNLLKEDTINLLKECNSGCKMATNSMEQVMSFIKDEKLKSVIDEYNDKHIKLGDVCHQLLNENHETEKDPPSMAKASSWIQTEVKLRINDDNHRIADLLINGCNMGITSLSEYINKYKNASKESIELARDLVKLEQDFMKELLAYL